MKNEHFRIAILSVHSSPLGQPGIGDTGGMSIYIRELTKELAQKGHNVDIFTRVQNPITPEIIDLDINTRQIHIPAGEPADLEKLLIYSHVPDFACKVENFRKQNNLQYKLIFSHYWLSGIAGLYLRAWWQVPQIIMFHTLGALKNAIRIGEDESDLRIEAEGRLANESDLIIAATEKEKLSLKKLYDVPAHKISVIPCGVNLNLFKPMDKLTSRKALGLGEGKIILFVGRIERLKGIDTIIRALPYLGKIKPKLIIVGEDGNRKGEMDNLKILAESLGVADSVNFSGLIDYHQLPLFYNSADVCVLPSYYESFGLVTLESLACGTPVIASDVGNLRNIILQGETGYILSENTPLQLAEKLDLILSGNIVSFNDSNNIRNSVEKFDWQLIAGRMEQEIDNLLHHHSIQATANNSRRME
jgi:D-inositol-3-phosphate glycosyltransferase